VKTSLKKESVKTCKLKNAIKEAYEFCFFDEPGFVGKLTTRSRTSHGETPRSKKIRKMQSMERFEIPKMM
jgi:hypothetical protein